MANKQVTSDNKSQEKRKKSGEHDDFMKKNDGKGNHYTKNSLKSSKSFFIKPSPVSDIKGNLSTYSTNAQQNLIPLSSQRNKVEKIRNRKEEKSDDADSKKCFNKKQYRFKKYSKKYKLQQWEEQKKQKRLLEYHHFNKNEESSKLNVREIYEKYDENCKNESTNNQNEGNPFSTESDNLQRTTKFYLKPHERYQKLKEERQKKSEEKLLCKAKREETIKKSRKEKFERNKKLLQKTKKGQPIMKYRLEMLLEKIENNLKN